MATQTYPQMLHRGPTLDHPEGETIIVQDAEDAERRFDEGWEEHARPRRMEATYATTGVGITVPAQITVAPVAALTPASALDTRPLRAGAGRLAAPGTVRDTDEGRPADYAVVGTSGIGATVPAVSHKAADRPHAPEPYKSRAGADEDAKPGKPRTAPDDETEATAKSDRKR